MCSFITPHNATDAASFEGACNWHADCRNVHQSCCPWIELLCSFLYHKPSPKAFQRIWQYIQPASQPQTTCNHISPGPPHPASSPPRSSETSHPDSCCNNRFDNQRISAQTVRNRLREAHLCMLFFHIGVLTWQQFVVVTDFGEAFSSWINLYMADMASCGWVVCWCQRCGSSGPWWRWGYGMGRRMLWTTNTGAFYWWDTVTRS